MRPKRSLLGQVFLRNPKYIEKILEYLEIKGKKILEVGPGDGTFTDYLASGAGNLHCVEYDDHFYRLLKERFAGKSKVKIIKGDILKFSIPELGKNIVIFGSLPYQISTKFIKYLIEQRKFIDKAYLILQKEFSQKLLAKANQGQYGFLSCYLQYYAKVNKVFDIPAKAFKPRPKVNSSFLEIDFYSKLPCKAINEDYLFKLVRKAFSLRRKKLRNSLGVASDLRPGQVSLERYISLANKLYPGRSF
jgi:16S rRNA (adenine1518-N6/adenine1519-N6)-dimethyltransferase